MGRLWTGVAAALFAWLACMALAFAQGEPTPTQRLDRIRADLGQIEQTLRRESLSDADLRELRARLDPLESQAQAVVDQLTPRLNAAKARLDQLGPKPAAGAAPEAAQVTSERDEQQKLFNELDGTLKRARLLIVDVNDAAGRILSRRRDLFSHALFERSYSILDPGLWIAVVRDMPGDLHALATVAGDWGAIVRAQLRGWNAAWFAAAMAAVALFYFICARAARRVLDHDVMGESPTDLRKALSAIWVTLVTAAAPVVAARAVVEAIGLFDLSNARLDPFVEALAGAVIFISTTLGIVRGLIAPHRPKLRLLDIGDRVAGRVAWVAISVSVVVAATRVIEAVDELIAASVPAAVAVRGVSALAVAGVMMFGLYGLIQPDPDDTECLGPRVAPRRDWYAFLRIAAWAAIAVLIAAVVVGYIAFASFVINQIVWVSFIGTMAYLLNVVADNGVAYGLRPQGAFGRALISSLGVRRESLAQVSILLTGLLSAGLITLAALLCLAPWGIESGDMFSAVRAAFFGFQVGAVTVSLSTLVMALILFCLVIGVTRILQRWLETRFLPATQLDQGLRASIRTIVGYAGFLIAAVFAIAELGLNLERIAIVAGALSVGIGFGLQSIVNNFVSGLILLWERAIRVGDWVVVGDDQGHVRRINVRSTEIETFDRAMMIVPNSNIVSGVVKNWVRADRVGRIHNAVSVTPDSDPEKVRETLLACAGDIDLVQKYPPPSVLFTGIAMNALNFELVCFVSDVEKSQRVRSDLYFEIVRRLREAGINLFPPAGATRVQVDDLQNVANALAAVAAPRAGATL
jgi:small-conductance mechanosensitive channel